MSQVSLGRPEFVPGTPPGHPTAKFLYQRAPNPPEFAQPRLSRVKRQSSPARGYKFGCVCSYMASHKDAGTMTGHIGTNTPKFVHPRWGRPPFDPTQTGLCKFGWVWSSLTLCDFSLSVFSSPYECHLDCTRIFLRKYV